MKQLNGKSDELLMVHKPEELVFIVEVDETLFINIT